MGDGEGFGVLWMNSIADENAKKKGRRGLPMEPFKTPPEEQTCGRPAERGPFSISGCARRLSQFQCERWDHRH